jgi:CO/xanthine dehydrogenase Mo-binding subunit
VLVDVRVTDAAEIQLERAVITADAGLVIDPDGLINQLEGGFIQAASWTLKEAVLWDVDGVTTRDWESYPILKFSEVPRIETYLVDRPLERTLGAGEASTGPTPAAIGNAVFDATGLRLREIPFSAERVRQAASA